MQDVKESAQRNAKALQELSYHVVMAGAADKEAGCRCYHDDVGCDCARSGNEVAPSMACALSALLETATGIANHGWRVQEVSVTSGVDGNEISVETANVGRWIFHADGAVSKESVERSFMSDGHNTVIEGLSP